jgi:hypothetical protein
MNVAQEEGATEMDFPRTSICRSVTVGIVLALAGGCASEKAVPKTASSGERLPQQVRRLRNSDDSRAGTGLSSQSRDIEKDLGYR